jgi:carboxyl-terminal processing protease
MIERTFLRLLLLALSGTLALPLRAVPSVSSDMPVTAESADNYTNVAPVVPGRMDGRVAFVSARLLEVSHYSRQPFDAGVSSKFYDRYLESLDREHLQFLQSDLAEFDHYRTNLGALTITRKGSADTRPACEIFNRFRDRLKQRVEYVDELLKTEKFAFDTDERIKVNRKDSAYPKDLDEAKALWRQRLRFDYLQEHLAKLDAKKKTEEAAKKAAKDGAAKTDAKPAEKTTPVKPKTEAEEIVEKLTHTYHHTLHNFADWDGADVLQVYLDTLAHVYDPHSDYMGPAPLDNFAINMNLSLFGIGAQLIAEDGYCTIQKLLPGGPALAGNKIHEKDRIVAVAQTNLPPVNVVGMRLDRAVSLIRGPKGTEVRLTIIPDGKDEAATEVVSIIRDKIRLEEQEAKAKVIDLPAAQADPFRIGYINLPSFYGEMNLSGKPPALAASGSPGPASTTADVARLLKKLKQENVRGVILDLRNNGGGFLEEAIRLTGLFIKEGPVVQVRDADLNVEEESDRDPSVLYDGPLLVLANRFSASASEIVAGALQDYGRALIIGDASTHGKGTVQSVNPLAPHMLRGDPTMTNDPGALKLTVKKFYRASGASTQLKGVVPDIILPSVFNEAKEFGEGALENPLPWDTIESAKYDHLNRVEPYLTDLRQHSAQRIAASKDFDYVREDIALFKKAQADKTVSLNEKQRLKEKDEQEARQKAREREVKARKPASETVYELTVKQAELPGLPEAVQKTNSSSTKVTQPPGTVIAAKDASKRKDLEDDSEKPPPVDAVLIEAEHILMDYYSLLSKQKGLTAAP